MQFRFFNPSAALAPYIRQYWTLEMDAVEARSNPHRVVPNGFVELTFQFGDDLKTIGKKEGNSSAVQLCGQKNGFYDLLPSGKVQMLSVVFRPQGAAAFFDFPLNELANQSIALELIHGREACELLQRMGEQNTFEEKVALLEGFFIGKINLKKSYELMRIDHTVSLIRRCGGQTTTESLAQSACLSRKQFERSFGSFAGLSPKQFQRVVRFQHAIFCRQKNPHISLTGLAYQSGYYDQAHLIREFKSLSGLTPKEFFADCPPHSDYFG